MGHKKKTKKVLDYSDKDFSNMSDRQLNQMKSDIFDKLHASAANGGGFGANMDDEDEDEIPEPVYLTETEARHHRFKTSYPMKIYD